jgi:hypothetical protein
MDSRYTLSRAWALFLLPMLGIPYVALAQTAPATQGGPIDPREANRVATQTRMEIAGLLLEYRPVGDYVESANRQFYDGAWDQAMVQYLLAERIKPGHFHARYQLARIFSNMGQSEPCARWFAGAVECGFSQHALARTDPLLAGVFKDKPELLETIRLRYQANLSKHVIVVRPAGEPPIDGWPVVLLMHGYGRSAAYFKTVADNAAENGFLGVALDGPLPWTTPDDKAFGWPDDNVEGNHAYLQDALKTIVTFKYNPKRVYVGGFSQGGLQAAILLARTTPNITLVH